MFQILTVLSMEFERREVPSGDTEREVIVSWWPIRVYNTDLCRTSHTFISSSKPPLNT